MQIKRLILGALGTNCYIIYDQITKLGAVIDPAGDAQRLIDEIKNLKIDVKYIILTHAHIDHILALDDICNVFNAKVVIHTDDSTALNNDSYNLAMFFHTKSPNKKADIVVKDKDILKLGENELKFIHTPGHTKGSMCILVDDILISGDTLFYVSIGRTDFYGGSYGTIMRSIKEKLFTLDDNTRVYPGHGEETTIGYEKQNNPFVI